jgi:hypothetical protein
MLVCFYAPSVKFVYRLTGTVAYELALKDGLTYEKRVFYGLFATNDQKEGELRAGLLSLYA